MDVLFATRKDFTKKPGGDTVQLLSTKKYLEELYDINVIIIENPEEIKKYNTAKIVHIFNLQAYENAKEYISICKECDKKIVLSTIYWDMSYSNSIGLLAKIFKKYSVDSYDYYIKDILINVQKMLFRVKGRKDIYGSKYYNYSLKSILEEVDLLLPNSYEELEVLNKEFYSDEKKLDNKTIVVPNAIEISIDKKNYKEVLNLKNYVLEIARIEPNKNQIKVIEALMEYDNIPIVFVGRSGNKGYYEKLKKLCKDRGNAFIIDEVPHDEIYNYYISARVHVMPSFRESPGLSSMEALSLGKEIVVSASEFCPIKYYEFERFGHICNPYDTKSIQRAIFDAYNNPQNTSYELLNLWKKKFSYETVADITFSAYKNLYINI